jgi:hypothetical protein
MTSSGDSIDPRRLFALDCRGSRAWFNGRMAAFQAAGLGSIPCARSIANGCIGIV